MVRQGEGWSFCIILGQVLTGDDGQLGREADIVFQICRRCLVPSSEIHLPAITSAFTLPSVPGHIFIEAFNITDVRRAVAGLVTVRDKHPTFIPPTECVGIFSLCHRSPSRIESGQWVYCLAGRYRDDVGYVCESSTPMYQCYAVVAFVPRIPQPGGKRQRDGRPTPRAWTAEELTQHYGERRVKVLGRDKFSFRGCLYQDGLAFELLPLSLLRVSEQSRPDFTPFVLSATIRSLPSFAASLKRYAQDSVQVGDRILVVSGEHAGVIGRIGEIHDEVVNVVTQIPERHSGLIICVSMRGIIPYFLEGDHVKIPWLDRFGMVIAVDRDEQKVTFLDNKINTEVCPSLPLPTALIDFCLYRSTRRHLAFSSTVIHTDFSILLLVFMLNFLGQVVACAGAS